MSHGDVLCVVVDGEYTLGDLLVPHTSGLCRKAIENEAIWATIHHVALPKITAIFPESKEFVACFMN
jgi:hypothetical protein